MENEIPLPPSAEAQARKRLHDRDDARAQAQSYMDMMQIAAERMPTNNARRAFWKKLLDLIYQQRNKEIKGDQP